MYSIILLIALAYILAAVVRLDIQNQKEKNK